MTDKSPSFAAVHHDIAGYPDIVFHVVWQNLMNRTNPRIDYTGLKRLHEIATGERKDVENVWGDNISRASGYGEVLNLLEK